MSLQRRVGFKFSPHLADKLTQRPEWTSYLEAKSKIQLKGGSAVGSSAPCSKPIAS